MMGEVSQQRIFEMFCYRSIKKKKEMLVKLTGPKKFGCWAALYRSCLPVQKKKHVFYDDLKLEIQKPELLKRMCFSS